MSYGWLKRVAGIQKEKRVKLTNESVARALGWTVIPQADGRIYFTRHKGHGRFKAPAYTTSLDAIVPEIEVRGLMYSIIFCGAGRDRCVGTVGPHLNKGASVAAKTAPLALCSALLAFLEAKG